MKIIIFIYSIIIIFIVVVLLLNQIVLRSLVYLC